MATSPALIGLRDDLRRLSAASASSRDPRATRRHLALCVADPAIRKRLDAGCTEAAPCRLICCPGCARRRAARYLSRSIIPALAPVIATPGAAFAWLTILTNEAADLTGGEAQARRHFRALRPMLGGLAIRLYGAREVEPRCDPASGAFTWVFHWHIVVVATGATRATGHPRLACSSFDAPAESNVFATLADRLRTRFTAPRAIHLQPIRAPDPAMPAALHAAATTRFNRSLRTLTTYPAKRRFTYRDPAHDRRVWLPPGLISDLVDFLESQGPRWSRFTMKG